MNATGARKGTVVLLALLLSAAALAAKLPYDESADAKADVQRALAQSRARHLPMLIIFGANWCEDCRVLDAALNASPSAELIAKSFSVVKVDVGDFDKNLDIAQAYGNPIKIGIPGAAVVSEGGRILYATEAGELADARKMSRSGIYDFFKRVSQRASSGG